MDPTHLQLGVHGARQLPLSCAREVHSVQVPVGVHLKGWEGCACVWDGRETPSHPIPAPGLGFPPRPWGLTPVEELHEVQSRGHHSPHPRQVVGPQHALRLGAQFQAWG